jgi:D-sedoheptulose 7-phosphate isomerase
MQDPRTKNDMPEAKTVHGYLQEYTKRVQKGLSEVPAESLEAAISLLKEIIQKQKRVYVGGNGGSAAIADHLLCDFVKGTATTAHTHLKVQSLVSSTALFTAIGNDYGYEHTLAFPLEIHGEEGDLAILISSSGNSANIVKAAEMAKKKKMKIIGLTGFDGGKLREMADVRLHIGIHNYGMVEDAHQSLMHTLAQFLYLMKTKNEI